jgi:hypothetical protein
MTYLARIRELIGPPEIQPPAINWQHIEDELGLVFPSDYKQLVATYPPLVINDWLEIHHPVMTGLGGNLISYAGSLLPLVRGWPAPQWYVTHIPRRECRTDRQPPFPVYPDPAGLFHWGFTETNVHCLWLTDPNPEKWTVVIADECTCWHYKGSLTTFLVDFLENNVRSSFFPNGVGFDEVDVAQILS